MRSPVRLQQAPRDENACIEGGAVGAKHSLNTAVWETGLVLAVFLGLALMAGATLTAFGLN